VRSKFCESRGERDRRVPEVIPSVFRLSRRGFGLPLFGAGLAVTGLLGLAA
jgi:hypothetical protein